MKLDQPNHDDAIEKTLAVLQRAAPPEGMEERILQRLHQHTSVAPTAQFFWRDLLAGSALTSAWWRGAVSGAATAALLVGALLLPQHGLRTRSGHTPQPAISQVTATPNLAPAVVTVTASASANNSHTTPCATPGLLRTARVVPVYRAESIASASFAPSRPAPILPLTAEERALVRLAQTADPKLLATLAPEAQAKNVAQEANDFDKFFAPPPAPPQPPDGESPTNTQEIRTAPQQGEQI